MIDFIVLCLVVSFVALLFNAFMLHRSNWVTNNRIRMIQEDYLAFERAPSYERMLWTFWIWNPRRYFYPEEFK